MNKTFTFLALCLLMCFSIEVGAQAYDQCAYGGPSSPATEPAAPINPAYSQTGPVICSDGSFPECSSPAPAGASFAADCGSPNFDFVITNPQDVATGDGGPAVITVSGDGAVDPSAFGLAVGDDVCVTGFCYDLVQLQTLVDEINNNGSACSAAASLAGQPVCPIPVPGSLADLFALAGSLGGGGAVSTGDVVALLPQLDQLGALGITNVPVCGLLSGADANTPDYCLEVVDCAAGSPCVAPIVGCMDPCAPNYDPTATEAGPCDAYDMTCNTDCTAGPFGGTWDAATCGCINETTPVNGCTDASADNFDPAANCDDNSCTFGPGGSCGACSGTGGLYITELSFNPTSGQGSDGDCEFIEIYNGFSNTVSLDNVVISNGLDFAFPPGSTIAPGEYIVILSGGDPTACNYTFAPGVQIFNGFDNGNLGNSNPETLMLTLTCPDDGSTVVTMVTYGGVIGDNDGNSVNYEIATATEFGAEPSPGSGDCTGCAGEYSCGGGMVIMGCTDMCSANFDPAATQDDGSCTAQLNGCTNPAADNYDPTALCDDGSCVTTGGGSCGACTGDGGLYITELSFNPTSAQGSDGDCEFIEIYNAFSNTVSLDNVVISNGLDFAFPAGSTIAPGEYIVILSGGDPTACNYTFATGVQIFNGFDNGNLGNSNPETLMLTLTCPEDGSTVVTMVTYGGVIGDNDGNSVNYDISTNSEYGAEPSPGSGDCTGCAGAYDCSAPVVMGCTDPCSANYDPAATQDDGSCSAQLNGCTNPAADNYDASALCDDGSCILTCNPIITTFPANCPTNGGN